MKSREMVMYCRCLPKLLKNFINSNNKICYRYRVVKFYIHSNFEDLLCRLILREGLSSSREGPPKRSALQNRKVDIFLSFFFMSVLAFLVPDAVESGSVFPIKQRHGFGSGSALLLEGGSGTAF
jgi:hypothetical protein